MNTNPTLSWYVVQGKPLEQTTACQQALTTAYPNYVFSVVPPSFDFVGGIRIWMNGWNSYWFGVCQAFAQGWFVAQENDKLKKALEETLNMLEKAFFSEGEVCSDEADKWIEKVRKEFNLKEQF